MERKAARQAGRGTARARQGHLPTCMPILRSLLYGTLRPSTSPVSHFNSHA